MMIKDSFEKNRGLFQGLFLFVLVCELGLLSGSVSHAYCHGWFFREKITWEGGEAYLESVFNTNSVYGILFIGFFLVISLRYYRNPDTAIPLAIIIPVIAFTLASFTTFDYCFGPNMFIEAEGFQNLKLNYFSDFTSTKNASADIIFYLDKQMDIDPSKIEIRGYPRCEGDIIIKEDEKHNLLIVLSKCPQDASQHPIDYKIKIPYNTTDSQQKTEQGQIKSKYQ